MQGPPAGNRLSVAELSGRTVISTPSRVNPARAGGTAYGYDDLYRLTSETVASDPKGNNGQVTYTLDNVGNRLQLNSTLPAIVPTGLLSYDANDRVSTDTFDANGNTTINSGQTNVYDFENHLVQRGGVTLVYDGDGNRVKETVAGVTTAYLVADQNPTGYAQVLDEIQGGAVTRTYSYGLELINERQTIAGTLTTSFYGYDGHGSVRFLTSSTGAITDTYDYDAFGNVISSTGSTPNNYLFAGEQFDPALGIYYNRARYYDQRQGRFWTMDTFEGDPQSPASLHRYLYTGGNPVDRFDPSGRDFIDVIAAVQVYAIGVAQALGPVTHVLGFAFAALNIGLLFTNDQFRDDVLGALGPTEAANLVRADLDLLFEFGGEAASAGIRAVRGAQTTITLDLFGGSTSQISGAINVDLRAQSGVIADVTTLPFADESVNQIVASGPRAPFLDEASRVLKPGGRIYINATVSNRFAQLPDEGTLSSLRLRVVQEFGPLDPQFPGPFLREDGTPVAGGDLSKITTTILEKY